MVQLALLGLVFHFLLGQLLHVLGELGVLEEDLDHLVEGEAPL